jgi:hypothetical protein
MDATDAAEPSPGDVDDLSGADCWFAVLEDRLDPGDHRSVRDGGHAAAVCRRWAVEVVLLSCGGTSFNAGGRCLAGGEPESCSRRLTPSRVLAISGHLPRRQPGIVGQQVFRFEAG